jgi:hypothetical protein
MQAILTPRERHIFDFVQGIAVDIPTSEELELTLQDLRPVQGSALLIGGLAVIHYGYERSTGDVDILYAQSDGGILKRLRSKFKLLSKSKGGWHHLENKKTGVRLELIPEGGLTTYGFIPGPVLVGGSEGFISRYGLAWLKLVSGRSKDITDLVELAKRDMKNAEAVCKKLIPELQNKYRDVLTQARKEMKNDPHNDWSKH